ncbi:hypothetical protein BGZ63DRAFT_379672 [Mariannaea sp. PMI_226]|nr:hypothetical protein BGZ63DRAFT_379672 [Mariannaea sp. PMI_226]
MDNSLSLTSSEDSASDAWTKFHGSWTKTDNDHLAYVCRAIYVVAGRGTKQISLPFSVYSLEQSPVIKEWNLYPYIEPPAVRRDGNLYLEDWEPDVVKGILFSLQSMREGHPDLLPHFDFWLRKTDSKYFIKFYLLAASLGSAYLSITRFLIIYFSNTTF